MWNFIDRCGEIAFALTPLHREVRGQRQRSVAGWQWCSVLLEDTSEECPSAWWGFTLHPPPQVSHSSSSQYPRTESGKRARMTKWKHFIRVDPWCFQIHWWTRSHSNDVLTSFPPTVWTGREFVFVCVIEGTQFAYWPFLAFCYYLCQWGYVFTHVCFLVCLFVLFVCQTDWANNTKPICSILGGQMLLYLIYLSKCTFSFIFILQTQERYRTSYRQEGKVAYFQKCHSLKPMIDLLLETLPSVLVCTLIFILHLTNSLS